MFFWNSLAFSMIQQILAIWSLVPLPFLKPAWTSGNSWFTYCWGLAWRVLSITLLAFSGSLFFEGLRSSTTGLHLHLPNSWLCHYSPPGFPWTHLPCSYPFAQAVSLPGATLFGPVQNTTFFFLIRILFCESFSEPHSKELFLLPLKHKLFGDSLV